MTTLPQMQERIVYFLGAGFSAPLGVPVMSDFYLRSKDLYFSDTAKYRHFLEVFDAVDKRMAKALQYYRINLFNIEDIFSLIEMEAQTGRSDTGLWETYRRYLRDVVQASTPVFASRFGGTAWTQWGTTFRKDDSDLVRLADDSLHNWYAAFVASLFRVQLARVAQDETPPRTSQYSRGTSYSVITMNYDVVLENARTLLSQVLSNPPEFRDDFATSLEMVNSNPSFVPLAKLHGSVEPLTIVPPSWNKSGYKENQEAWRLAHTLLADATQIRFIGYSLPTSDNYVRFLLASAVTESKHLKRTDCLCLDRSVEKRFRKLVTFEKFRFAELDVSTYLGGIQEGLCRGVTPRGVFDVGFTTLEGVHDRAFSPAGLSPVKS